MAESRADYRTLPTVDRRRIARDLRGLGLRAGDTVLVHSAMSRIGNVEGGAAAVVDALQDALGPRGTLAVPTFPFRGIDAGPRAQRPGLRRGRDPVEMGAITEEVRTRPGALRSLEPTHPVAALGPLAEFLVEDHVNAEGPCDKHSPLYRLAQIHSMPAERAGAAAGRGLPQLHAAARGGRVRARPVHRLRDALPPARPVAGAARTPVALLPLDATELRANFPAVEPELIARGQLTSAGWGAPQLPPRLAHASDILACGG